MLLNINCLIAVLINNISDEPNNVTDIQLRNVQKHPSLKEELPEYIEAANLINSEHDSNKYLKRNPENKYTGERLEDDEVYGLKEDIYDYYFGPQSFNQREYERFKVGNGRVVQNYR